MNKTEHTDILIVGQGLAGTLLSYHLLKRKIAHKIIDIYKAGCASRAAAGLINPIVVKRITRTWQADIFQPYAHSLYSELEQFLAKRFYYPMPINKIYGKDDEQFWRHRMQKDGLEEQLSCEAKTDLPEGIHQPYGYGTIHRCARLDMITLLDSYRQFITQNKILIEDELYDDDVLIAEEGVQWKHIKAGRIIFCRGSFDSKSRFFEHLKWNNTKGELLDVEIPDLHLPSILSKGVFVMPVGANRFKIGATYAHHWEDLAPTEDKLEELMNKWQIISDLPLSITQQITGIRPTLADRRPVLSLLEKHPQVGLFNGLGSRGGLMAPYLAKQLTEQISYLEPSI
ncbi:FAD-binding oxidoreductase [Carboxylicivirga mesophila]|uniref:FAD-binding oxidoreductase n=1 Tax=Carboxylicivirga mesophila TaxID=1166478 RepID=A0ABS5K6A9_9BACT|nr:FAD-dependent oxidoreductase [Carboxylicivirga mesophila]MBS2210539.1 FAD-binding oxidoreductase [Carboxylicivirga mesophila]